MTTSAPPQTIDPTEEKKSRNFLDCCIFLTRSSSSVSPLGPIHLQHLSPATITSALSHPTVHLTVTHWRRAGKNLSGNTATYDVLVCTGCEGSFRGERKILELCVCFLWPKSVQQGHVNISDPFPIPFGGKPQPGRWKRGM